MLPMSPLVPLFLLACSPGGGADSPLAVDGALVEAGGLNAWILSWSTPEASDGVVRLVGGDGGRREFTDVESDAEGLEHRAVILGLPAGTNWTATAYSSASGREYATDAFDFETSPVPTDLPTVTVSVPPADGLTGFVVLPLATLEGVQFAILDLDGNYVWWRTSFAMACFRAEYEQATGVLSTCSADEADGSHFSTESLVDGTGTTVVTSQGHHDFVALSDGSYLALGEDRRQVDGLNVVGDTVVLVPAAGGEASVVWNAWDSFAYDGIGVESPNGMSWPHLNSLEFDEGTGKLLLGAYSRDSILQVDRATGAIDWELGGELDDFGLEGDETFVHPHSPRRVGNEITLVDAGASDGRARVISLHIDESAWSAGLGVSVEGGAAGGSSILGNAEHIDGDRLFVAWGSGGTAVIMERDGTVLWQADTELGVALGYGQYIPSLLPGQ